jgi:hypothetical protein
MKGSYKILGRADHLMVHWMDHFDKGSITTTPTILPPPYVLKLGQFCFEVPLEDDVKPNFCTPPMEFHGRRGTAAKDI